MLSSAGTHEFVQGTKHGWSCERPLSSSTKRLWARPRSTRGCLAPALQYGQQQDALQTVRFYAICHAYNLWTKHSQWFTIWVYMCMVEGDVKWLLHVAIEQELSNQIGIFFGSLKSWPKSGISILWEIPLNKIQLDFSFWYTSLYYTVRASEKKTNSSCFQKPELVLIFDETQKNCYISSKHLDFTIKKLLHWKNIDQLCMTDPVAFVEEE